MINTSGIKKHLVDTSAILVSSHPIGSFLENVVSGMPDEVSIKSRLTGSALCYLGLGYLFNKGREISRKIFNVNDSSKEAIKIIHDGVYSAGYNVVVNPPIFLAMGANLEQTIVGTATIAATCPLLGPIMGYAVDATRDLLGIEPCNRSTYPDLVRRQTPAVKRNICLGLVATSIGTMATIYGLTPN